MTLGLPETDDSELWRAAAAQLIAQYPHFSLLSEWGEVSQLSRWAMRFSSSLGLCTESLRVVVIMAQCLGSRVLPDAARVAEVHQVLRELNPAASATIAQWLLEQYSARSECIAGVSRDDARRVRLAFELPAVVVGRPAQDLARFAAAVAPLVCAVESMALVWSPAPCGDALRTSLFTRLSLSQTERDRLQFVLAGDFQSAIKQREIKAVFSRPAVVKALDEFWELHWEECARCSTAVSQADAILPLLGREYQRLSAVARAASVVSGGIPQWGEMELKSAARYTLELGVERLRELPELPGSVEHQRFGLSPVKARVSAPWFPKIWVWEVLLEIDPSVEREYTVLEEVPEGELRYYAGFKTIPPDADSLGAALRLCARLSEPPRARVQSWLSVLDHSLCDDGGAQVWFSKSKHGLTSDRPDLEWSGNQCTASLLSLVYGLLVTGERKDVAIATLRRLLACWVQPTAVEGSYWYPSFVALWYWSRIAETLRAGLEVQADLASDIMERAQRSAQVLLEEQRSDGSWGSPLRTALYLDLIRAHGNNANSLRCAVRFLVESQRGDGLWEAEFLYYVPGRLDTTREHRPTELTSALILAALNRALD